MAPTLRSLDAAFAVTAQLSPADVPGLAALGFATLINNRPDGEGGEAQALSQDIALAARAAGLTYVYLPVVGGAITPAQAAAMRQALAASPQPVLAFCRSGARSAELYKLARMAD